MFRDDNFLADFWPHAEAWKDLKFNFNVKRQLIEEKKKGKKEVKKGLASERIKRIIHLHEVLFYF